VDQAFDVVELAKASGATFVARSTTYHARQLTDILRQAIIHDGFSVVEVLSQCPTYFGRKNKMGSAAQMMNWFKDHTVPVGSAKKEKDPSLIERGIFVQKELPEYCSEYEKIIARAQRPKEKL
jgi:2-oxoglutarate ferredoxin oxidoreductase subunit beta